MTLNVGGEKYEVMWKVLEKQPRSRLGLLSLSTSADQILNLCDAFSLEERVFGKLSTYFIMSWNNLSLASFHYGMETTSSSEALCVLY